MAEETVASGMDAMLSSLPNARDAAERMHTAMEDAFVSIDKAIAAIRTRQQEIAANLIEFKTLELLALEKKIPIHKPMLDLPSPIQQSTAPKVLIYTVSLEPPQLGLTLHDNPVQQIHVEMYS